MAESPITKVASPDGAAGSERLDRRTILLGLVIVSGTVMAILDTTIINVALETLGRDFSTGLSTIQWVITGYMLAMGTVIPLTGWAVDRFGGRRVWMTSIVLFVLGSALSGAAWNIESLIVFRVVQGLGGGMLVPTGMAILTMAAGPRRTGRMMSIYGLSTASSNGGFGEASTIAWLAGGVVLVGLFALHSLRLRERSLIDVRLFADRTFASAAVAVFFVGIALMGSMLLIPLYYQIGRGEGAFAAGLLLAPQGLGAATAMPLAGVVTDKLGAGRIVPVGIVILVLGTIPFALVGADTSYWLLGAALYVRGLGLGCTMMPTMSAALTTLSRAAVSRASSTLNIIVQLGGSVGTALLAVILSRQISDRIPQAADGGGGAAGGMGEIPERVREQVAPKLADAFGHTFWVALILTAVLILPALLLPRHGAQEKDAVPDALPPD